MTRHREESSDCPRFILWLSYGSPLHGDNNFPHHPPGVVGQSSDIRRVAALADEEQKGKMLYQPRPSLAITSQWSRSGHPASIHWRSTRRCHIGRLPNRIGLGVLPEDTSLSQVRRAEPQRAAASFRPSNSTSFPVPTRSSECHPSFSVLIAKASQSIKTPQHLYPSAIETFMSNRRLLNLGWNRSYHEPINRVSSILYRIQWVNARRIASNRMIRVSKSLFANAA
jgi:hypothetical protein